MLAAVAALCVAALVQWPASARRIRAADRLGSTRRARKVAPAVALRGWRLLGAGSAGLAPLVLLPWPVAVAVGAGTWWGAQTVLRRPVEPERARADEVAFVVDLVAAALVAGAPAPVALEAVAGAAQPPLSESLARAAAALRLGADPVSAIGPDPALRRLARVTVRSALHGAAAGSALSRLAADVRAEHASAAAARARKAGVHVVAPLVACFLPAFVLVAVLPLILGLLRPPG